MKKKEEQLVAIVLCSHKRSTLLKEKKVECCLCEKDAWTTNTNVEDFKSQKVVKIKEGEKLKYLCTICIDRIVKIVMNMMFEIKGLDEKQRKIVMDGIMKKVNEQNE